MPHRLDVSYIRWSLEPSSGYIELRRGIPKLGIEPGVGIGTLCSARQPLRHSSLLILVRLHALFDLFYNFHSVDCILRFKVVTLGLFLSKDDHLSRTNVSLIGSIREYSTRDS